MIRIPDEDALQLAVNLLRSGDLIGMPTETVYGLAGLATSPAAVAKIFALKGRPRSNPLIVHIASADQLDQCAFIDRSAPWVGRLEKLLPLWPGPLSILLPKAPHLPLDVTAGGPLVAVRVPSHPVATNLLSRLQAPVAAPSANMSGYVSPTTAHHVQSGLGSQLSLILDGGPCRDGIESTVLSITGPSPRIVRPGVVTVDVLESLLRESVLETVPIKNDSSSSHLESPGTMDSHYAPTTPVILKHDFRPAGVPGQRIGVLWFSATAPDFDYERIERLSVTGDPLDIAPRLYAALRDLDAIGFDCIVVDTCRPVGLGVAVMDRLHRATARKS